MASMTIQKALEQLDRTIERAATKGERVRVRRRGKQAVVMPVEDLRLIRAIEDFLDIRAVNKARAEAKRGRRPLTLEEVKRRLRL